MLASWEHSTQITCLVDDHRANRICIGMNVQNHPMYSLGTLRSQPALERPELLADPVRAALDTWDLASKVEVVEIDPEHADTATLCEVAQVPAESGANCVIISGKRAGEERLAAVLVPAHRRADPRQRAAQAGAHGRRARGAVRQDAVRKALRDACRLAS